jgi:hypothetical protein
MTGMTTTTAPAPAKTAICDKVRDPLKDTEFEGKLVWNCIKPAGHDKRGAHLMEDDKGRRTHWRGADNE